jgi:hypothetical protein
MFHPISRAWYTTRSTSSSTSSISARDVLPSDSYDLKSPSSIVLIIVLTILGIGLLYLMFVFVTGRDIFFRSPRSTAGDIEAQTPPQENKTFGQRYLLGLRSYKKPSLSTVPEQPAIEMSNVPRSNTNGTSMQDIPLTPPAPTLHRKPTHPKYNADYFRSFHKNNPTSGKGSRGKGKKVKSPERTEGPDWISPANPFYEQHLQRQKTDAKLADNPYQWEQPGVRRKR